MRYYFHVCNSHDVLLDPEGVELPDIGSAITVAMGEARALIAAEAFDGRIDLGQHIDVHNEQGKTVHSLAFADAVAIAPVGHT